MIGVISKIRARAASVLFLGLAVGALGLTGTSPAYAWCCAERGNCDQNCVDVSQEQRDETNEHIVDEFEQQQTWMIQDMLQQRILPALMLFAEQMTATAMQQTMMIGAMLDAKHQLETQRLFQQLMAQAHKDYHPSEGMCTFGTITRSLAAADRGMDLSANVFSTRVTQRELLSGDSMGGAGGRTSDFASRVKQFVELYCNRQDNGQGLTTLCPAGSRDPNRVNNDINYTNLFDSALTLNVDFTPSGNADHAANAPPGNVSADEEDLFALSANLYAHNIALQIPPTFLIENGEVKDAGANYYMNMRAITAKRSVARNSFASIAALKTQGTAGAQPYMHAIMSEFGLPDNEIEFYVGDRPSYYAQMEILTKKLYQNPTFYTELYDKPVNVARKTASMQAIELMQRRDIYRSVLRSEAIMAVMLETALMEQQEKVSNEINRLSDDAPLVSLP